MRNIGLEFSSKFSWSPRRPRCRSPFMAALWFHSALEAFVPMVSPTSQLSSHERRASSKMLKPSGGWTVGKKMPCRRFLPGVSMLHGQQETELGFLWEFSSTLSPDPFQTGKSFWVIEMYSFHTSSVWEKISMARSR